MIFRYYGNIKTQTTYGDYGYWVWDADNQLPDDPRTTEITYDPTYQMYPIRVENAAGHTTNMEYYGVNGIPMVNAAYNGGARDWQKKRGALRSVTDINGIATIYEYDPFGRLWQIFDSEADMLVLGENVNPLTGAHWNGNPAQRIRYWDNTWEHPAGVFVNQDDGNGRTPFMITTHTYPAIYNVAGDYRMGQAAYFDGLGRVVQTREWDIDDEGVQKDRVTMLGLDAQGNAICSAVPQAVGRVELPNNGYITGGCKAQAHVTLTEFEAGDPFRSSVTTPDLYTTTSDGEMLGASHQLVGAGESLVYRSVEDANDQVKATLTDILGRMVEVIEYDSSVLYAQTQYDYDKYGNLVQVTDDAGNVSQMTYDSLGRKLSMADPDMGDWTYEYDAQGNLISQTDANYLLPIAHADHHERLCFYYDELNRLTLKGSVASGACPATKPADTASGWTWLANYQYDDFVYYWGESTANASSGDRYGGLIGALSRVEWPEATGGIDYEMFAYDDEGRAVKHTRVIDGQSYTMRTVSFDHLDRPLTVSYPDGELVEMTYDHEGAETLTVAGSQLVDNVVYNELGQMTLLTRTGAPQETTYDYYDATGSEGNSAFRLKSVTHGDALGNGQGSGTHNVGDFEYTYDKVGNIASIIEYINAGSQTQTFTYDHLYRLKTASAPTAQSVAGYTESYNYDEIGNITGRNGVTYAYGGSQPHAVTAIGGQTFGYDPNGNMTSRNDSSGNFTQAFDNENRLVEVSGSGESTRFGYDPSGQRTMTMHPDGRIVYYPFPNYEEEFSSFPASVSLTVDDTAIGSNQSATLVWSATGATICFADWANDQPIVHSGSLTLSGASLGVGSHQYQLTCHDLTGEETIRTVTVEVFPTMNFSSFTIDHSLISSVSATTLRWTVTGAVFCDPSWSASDITQTGTASRSGLAQGKYTYTLTCYDFEGKTAKKSVDLEVLNPISIDLFTAEGRSNKAVAEPGSSIQVVWDVDGIGQTSDCNLSNAGSQITAFSGSLSFTAPNSEGSTTYTLSCTNALGQPASASVTVVRSHVFLHQAVIRGSEVHHRMTPVSSNDTIDFTNAGDWYVSMTDADFPGSGTIQAYEEYINGGYIFQLLWRNNQAYERRVPLTGDGEIDWANAPSWTYRGHSGEFPGTGDMQALFLTTIDNTLYQSFWRSNKLYTTTISNYGTKTIHDWRRNNVHLWNQVATTADQPGSGDMVAWTRYAWPDMMHEGFRRTTGTLYTRYTPINNGSPAWGTNAWLSTGTLANLPGSGTLRAQSGFVVDTNSSPFVQATHALVEFTGNRERPDYANSASSSVAHLTGDMTRTTAAVDVAEIGPQPLSASKVLARTADGVLGALDNITLNLTDDTSYKRYTQWTYTLGGAGTTPSTASIVGWWQVDLGGAHRIDRIRITSNGNGVDLNELVVSVTGSGGNWQHTHSGVVNNVLEIEVGSEIGEVVRLETIGGGNFLAMVDVEIFGNLALVEPDVTVRKTYQLGGQPIATRVSGHDDSTQNGLFYIYTDHLGSASNITDQSGKVVDTQRFLPFGEQRTAPNTTITERGFTGHHENRGIGLTYMNARFYVPSANRFLTPDSIVPNPTNPQSFNRYSYVRNNPLNRIDPSGHVDCSLLGDSSDTAECHDTQTCQQQGCSIVVAGGADNGFGMDGTDPSENMEPWQSNPWGYETVNVAFPADARRDQYADEISNNADNTNPRVLACYSAGSEACLLYASETDSVKIVILLGPTFSGADQNGNVQTHADWLNVLDSVVQNGTHVIIVFDADQMGHPWQVEALDHVNTATWDGPEGTTVVYATSPVNHFDGWVNHGIASDPDVAKAIYEIAVKLK